MKLLDSIPRKQNMMTCCNLFDVATHDNYSYQLSMRKAYEVITPAALEGLRRRRVTGEKLLTLPPHSSLTDGFVSVRHRENKRYRNLASSMYRLQITISRCVIFNGLFGFPYNFGEVYIFFWNRR